ncbi:hypothetical protein [Streptomyces sporangiiformans]|uniref:Uncharacterized protein n=1 Tax=Streptomyces sporangiiformans TaxID=2315329 RepID=A0A505D7L5_9ACTN|nr:hypothetical protein [Streptomyces sporangiiformans]TPQ18302.1 hypothetical protein FGD71_031400 [Streptomyces sporangiiformans]
MPVQTVPTRPTVGTYVVMAVCTGVATVLLGTLYLIYRDMAITGGCGSRYGVTCSGKQSAHVFAALVAMAASVACVLFLNWVVFRPYRRGHEAYRLVIPLLLAAGAVELFAAGVPLGGSATLLAAVGLLLASRKPVGVRGMVWGLSGDRLKVLTADPAAEELSTGQNVLFLCANAVGMALGLLGADRLFSSLG